MIASPFIAVCSMFVLKLNNIVHISIAAWYFANARVLVTGLAPVINFIKPPALLVRTQ
jgi:hypothetical protein